MDIVYFLLDTILFLAIVITAVILTTAGAAFVSQIGKANHPIRYGVPLLAFIASLISSSVLAYAYISANIPAGRWLNLFLLALIAPVLMPFIWSALKYTQRSLVNG